MSIVNFPGGDEEPSPDTSKKRTSRTKAELSLLRASLWQDRVSGKTYDQIAVERKMPVRTVIYNCQAAVREIDATAFLEEEMAISLSQLNYIMAGLWGSVLADVDSRDGWLKAYDRKMKLLGLEAPKRVDVRAEIVAWAEREGLDPDDVIDVTQSLLPVPKPPSYST